MKKLVLLLTVLVVCFQSFGQEMTTYQFAEKDGQKLYLDFYAPAHADTGTICVVYIFGGGFMSGERNDESGVSYCKHLAERGYQVAAIDYRLGMKGVKNVGITNYAPVDHAISIATEDAISALAYLSQNAKKLNVNTGRFVLVGSSAGAVTALETDYALCNGLLNASILSADFRLAGVVSYSGAIFSKDGKVKYRNHAPAPTLFFHGTADKIVTYNQLKLFKVGFFGANKLVKRFEKYDYPYYIRRYVDYGHSVACMFDNTIDELDWFCKTFIRNGGQMQIDEVYVNMNDAPKPSFDKMDVKDLYK